MPDIIVKQQPESNLTIQSSEDQVIIRQSADNVIVVQTTGNSYILPAATNSTLGGIIVGDNLSINANGVLSAQAGGVSSFNNRTGNVTLTANDVLGTATQFSGPAFEQFISANLPAGGLLSGGELIRGIKLEKFWNGQTNPFVYGFMGIGFSSNFYAGIVDKATNNITSVIELTPGLDGLGSFAIVSGSRAITVTQDSIYFDGDTGVNGKIYCRSSLDTNQTPAKNEVLTKGAADKLYLPISSKNA
jgi:hypothetical protein